MIMTRLPHNRTIEHLRNSHPPSELSPALNHVVSPRCKYGTPLATAHRENDGQHPPLTRPPARSWRTPRHLAQTRLLRFLCAIFRHHRLNERVAFACDDAEHLPTALEGATRRRASYVPPRRFQPRAQQLRGCELYQQVYPRIGRRPHRLGRLIAVPSLD